MIGLRRTNLLVVLSLFVAWVNAQSLSGWSYWFDYEKEPRKNNIEDSLFFSFEADASDLGLGIHTLHVQVHDTAGISSVPQSIHFYKLPSVGESRLRYWFDNDIKSLRIIDYSYGLNCIDIAHLTPGFHLLNCQVVDKYGSMSNIVTRAFWNPSTKYDQRLYYWFNQDKEILVKTDFDNGFDIDLSGVKEGFNTLYIQLVSNGAPSEIVANNFIKVPQIENIDSLVAVCVIDGLETRFENLPNSGGTIHWEIDVNNIDAGVHKALFQVITNTGTASTFAETYFIRSLTNADLAGMTCNYSIDGFRHFSQTGTLADGLFHFDLPVDSVENGLHRIDFMLIAKNGITTDQGSSWFFKVPLGGYGLRQYDYWLNDKSDEVHSVVLDSPQDPIQIIKLLPVSAEPIRSTCFQFETEDGKPIIFAKNDIHFRFHDKSGRWVDANSQYVDKNIAMEVAASEELVDIFGSESFDTPKDNEICWYSMTCHEGDSIAFKSSQAIQIQVFEPDATELLSADGVKSVNYFGCHTRKDGTYYIAIHDAAGTQQQTVMEYRHIEKFAILDYDVHVVGNNGLSSITINGNGLDSLTSIRLETEGLIIEAADVIHLADNKIMATFDFSNKMVGDYDMVCEFGDYSLTKSHAVQVENASSIELTVKVDNPSSFIRGSRMAFNITVANSGSATAYDVPIQIVLEGKYDNISSIAIESDVVESFSYLGMFENDSLDENIIEVLKQIDAETKGMGNFFWSIDEDGTDKGWNQYVVNIPPFSSVSIKLMVTSTSTLSCNAIIPGDWMTLSVSDNKPSYVQGYWNAPSKSSPMCCYKSQIQCVTETATNVIGLFLPPGIGCGVDIAQMAISTAMDVWCDDGAGLIQKIKNVISSKGNELTRDLIFTAVGCITGYFDKIIKPYSETLKDLRVGRLENLDVLRLIREQLEVEERNLKNITKQCDAAIDRGDLAEFARLRDLMAETKQAKESLQFRIELLSNEISLKTNEIDVLNSYIKKTTGEYYDILKGVTNGLKDLFLGATCSEAFLSPKPECPPNPQKDGGTSNAVNSYDPNDIIGYRAENGSLFINDNVDKVHYTIYFENDSMMASAAAQNVHVLDTLDMNVFDISTFEAESFGLANTVYDVEPGRKEFVKTIDVRPRFDLIVQVSLTLDEQKGIADWHFSSLDPMTVEPVTDARGFLPPNDYEHNGEGQVSYSISLKRNLPDFTVVPNKASNVFDNEAPYSTPVWTNIVDNTPPSSDFTDIDVIGDSIVRLHWQGFDNESGPWRYSLYVQAGGDYVPWIEFASNTEDSICDYHVYDGIDYAFCVLATDSAGNVEPKLMRKLEYSIGNEPQIHTDIPTTNYLDGVTEVYDLFGRRILYPNNRKSIQIRNGRKVYIDM